jgi:hypothetical protein
MVDKTGLNWTDVYGEKVNAFYGECKGVGKSETKELPGMPTFLKPLAWVQSGIGKWRDPRLKLTQAFLGRFS